MISLLNEKSKWIMNMSLKWEFVSVTSSFQKKVKGNLYSAVLTSTPTSKVRVVVM